jgi:hypothetical protein
MHPDTITALVVVVVVVVSHTVPNSSLPAIKTAPSAQRYEAEFKLVESNRPHDPSGQHRQSTSPQFKRSLIKQHVVVLVGELVVVVVVSHSRPKSSTPNSSFSSPHWKNAFSRSLEVVDAAHSPLGQHTQPGLPSLGVQSHRSASFSSSEQQMSSSVVRVGFGVVVDVEEHVLC